MASLPPKKDGSTTYKILPTASEKDRLLPPERSIADELNDIEEEKEESGATLMIAFVLMILFQLGNRIFGKLLTFPMHNYPMFTNMLSTCLYIPICFMYIFPMLYADKISKEQRDIPKYKFSVMGAMDSLAGIMQVFAVNYMTNASMIVLVQQSAIPISMIISRLTLNARYNTSQYSGAGVVLLGIIVVLLPNLMKPSEGSADSATTDFIWSLVLVVSCIPMCLSSVYKEQALGEVDIDVIYLNGWVAVFQFLFSIPLCFPSAFVMNLPYSEILPNMYGGLLCWFGINSVTEATSTLQVDECSLGPLFVTVYLFFNVIYNILIIVILKHGSANILWMASTVIVPLSNVAFSLDFMPGHQPLKTWDIVGLIVIMSGLVIYRFTSQLLALWEAVTGRLTNAEAIIRKRARAIQIKMERLQTKFIGINQVEWLQSLVDSRVMTAQRRQLFRSPMQIRGEFLHKLGIPPSPMLSLGPKGRYESLQYENGQNAMSRSSPRYNNRRQKGEHVSFAPSTKRASEV